MVIFTVVSITFYIIHSLPNSYIYNDSEVDEVLKEEFIKKYSLDLSLKDQYIEYISNISKGNLGYSMKYEGRKVSDVIIKNFPISLELSIRVLILSFLIGLPLGVKLAINKKYRYIYYIVSILISIPSFVIAGLIQTFLVFFYKGILIDKLNLPFYNISIIGFDSELQKLFPTITLSIFLTCIIIRILSRKIENELDKEYVEFALSKGLDIKYVVLNHIFKNIFPSLLSMLIPYFVSIVTGSFVVENLFGIPGLGRYYTSSIIDRDYSMVVGLTLFYTVILTTLFTLMDICISFLDRRVGRDV
jgi:ABC-type dipeptide/oligopeptide/nickel transport systems, permease components